MLIIGLAMLASMFFLVPAALVTGPAVFPFIAAIVAMASTALALIMQGIAMLLHSMGKHEEADAVCNQGAKSLGIAINAVVAFLPLSRFGGALKKVVKKLDEVTSALALLVGSPYAQSYSSDVYSCKLIK